MSEAYRSFGSFILFKEILRDHFGSIFRAGEIDAGGIRRNVWFRLFDAPDLPIEEIKGSFDQAGQIADVLKAANVASGLTFIVEDDIPAMAFDYVSGQPLSYLFEKVENEGFPVAVDNALLIMEKISLGLASGLVLDVGGRPLVHGLLHPSMILITNDGEGIISGFGIAESLLGMLDTQAGGALKPYLAPEVLMTRTPSKRSDVYSLGSILFQLLTGSTLPENPEEREAALNTAEMAYDGEPIPDDIMALLKRSLAPRMEDRFSSASDFKKELDKLLYGGNYSPTTFNLALFMDRLFRDEIDTTEKERAVEAEVDVEPYLKPEPEPEPEEIPAAASGGGSKGLYIVIAAALVLVAVGLLFVMKGGLGGPPAVPTPTPEEIAAKKAEEERRIQEMAARIAEQKLKEAEDKMNSALEESQKKVEELKKQLSHGKKTGNSAADAKRQEEIKKQIEAEKERQRQQQEAMRKERERLLEQSRKEAEAKAREEAAAAVQTATPTPEPRIAQAPTPEPTTRPQPTAAPAEQITENQFIPPTEVDSAPAILKEVPVNWPKSTRRLRHKKGMIIVQATVNAKGKVEAVKILRADETSGGVPEAVMAAVKKYVFKPGMKNGVKIKTMATVVKQYNFR